MHSNPPTKDQNKSWKKINEERKALKKLRKQEKLLKQLQKKQTQEQEKVDEKSSTSTTVEKKPNPSSVSIAVPGSILENAQSVELRTYVAGQIARAACIFRVSEVIVFDDVGLATARETKRNYGDDGDAEGGGDTSSTVRSSSLQLARILQYLECPQYLRKFFFPLHKDLKYSGLLNPLDAPHHLRQQNLFRYREGIVTEKQAKEGHSYINVGLLNDVLVNKALTAGLRVTVKLNKAEENARKQRGTIVSPDEPRRETGVYWGYTVRIAHSISEIFTKSPYPGGYDLTIGTSDRGASVHEVPSKSFGFNHLLVVFGGLQGLEAAVACDDKLQIDDPELLFDHYINVLPKQGSRTIRTEEAILVAMATLHDKCLPKNVDVEEELIQEALPRSEDTGGMIQKPGQTKKAKKRKRVEENTEATINQHEQELLKDEDLQTTDVAVKLKVKNTKNPFNHSNQRHDDTATANGFVDTVTDGDDFEVVPVTVDTPKIKKSKSSTTESDLSRFD